MQDGAPYSGTNMQQIHGNANHHDQTFELPDVYSFDFSKPGLEKPWNENKENIDEYFNYGM